MAIMIEGNYLGDLVKRESDLGNEYSREKVTIAAGKVLSLGEVLGKITKSIPTTGTKGDGNTGAGATGANAASVAGGPQTRIGTYTLTCTAAAVANPATPAQFEVKAPDGTVLPPASVGVAYTNPQINFTLAEGGGAGAVPFAAGDVITIPVTAGSGNVTPIDFTKVDGSQEAHGFAIRDYAAGSLRSVAFTSGGTYEIKAGDLVKGATSGAIASVHQAPTLASGAWANGDAAGTLILENQVGTFAAENLDVGTNLNVATIAANSDAYSPAREGVAIVRDAVIDPAYLVWPANATTAQKAAALARLKDKGILSDRPVA